MKIGVIGLGLIGASLAKAIKNRTEHCVLGADINTSVLTEACTTHTIDQELQDLALCDIVIVALYPKATVDYILKNKQNFKKGSIVVDCCGVKEPICNPLFEESAKNGFAFIGAHPMAGREFSGIKYADSSLFNGASMIVVPGPYTQKEHMQILSDLFMAIGFSSIKISTPEEHDKIIACTSQLAHIVSGAYVKSPTASNYRGFSAGSFKDMTRVARLNEDMWTELFMANSQNLQDEISGLIERLDEYRRALAQGDELSMKNLLLEGKKIKICLE